MCKVSGRVFFQRNIASFDLGKANREQTTKQRETNPHGCSIIPHSHASAKSVAKLRATESFVACFRPAVSRFRRRAHGSRPRAITATAASYDDRLCTAAGAGTYRV